MPLRTPSHRPRRPPQAAGRQYEQKASRRADIAFYMSNAWRRLRLAKLKADPICEDCRKRGRTTAAKQVHHIKDRKPFPDLALEWDNLESVCLPCHNRKRAQR